jgi:hypothetical protein
VTAFFISNAIKHKNEIIVKKNKVGTTYYRIWDSVRAADDLAVAGLEKRANRVIVCVGVVVCHQKKASSVNRIHPNDYNQYRFVGYLIIP